MDVYINLGSNQGDSEALIGRAVALVLERFVPTHHRLSPPYRSEPWGYESENEYVNVGLGMRIAPMEPIDILHKLQIIEAELNHTPHRNPDGTYRDRELDIDLIEISGVTISTPELTIPHPRAHLRPFVTIPLRQSRLE